jgi:hypothetical protein
VTVCLRAIGGELGLGRGQGGGGGRWWSGKNERGRTNINRDAVDVHFKLRSTSKDKARS